MSENLRFNNTYTYESISWKTQKPYCYLSNFSVRNTYNRAVCRVTVNNLNFLYYIAKFEYDDQNLTTHRRVCILYIFPQNKNVIQPYETMTSEHTTKNCIYGIPKNKFLM